MAPPPAALEERTVPTGSTERGERGAGVTAAASVPFANRANPEQDQAPAFTPQPRVYRATAPPPELPTRTPGEEVPPAAQPPRQRQPWLPVYSDLIGPAAPEQSPAGQPPQSTALGAGPGNDHWGLPDQANAAAPQPGMPGGTMPSYPPPGETAGPHIPQQRFAEPAPSAPPPPPAAAPDAGGGDDPDKTGPRTGVIVAVVLASAAALVLVTLGAAFGLSRLSQSSDEAIYNVGDCVIQAEDLAEPADCADPDAYEIVSQVDTRDECPDPSQPAIEVRGDASHFYCLESAAADEAGGDEAGAGEEGAGEEGAGEDGDGEDGDGSDEQ